MDTTSTELDFIRSTTVEPMWRRIVATFVMVVLLAHIFIPSISFAAECIKTGSMCVEGPGTRTVDGVSLTRECWRYEDSYSCSTAVEGQKSCDPLKSKTGCGQTFTNCVEYGIDGQCSKFTRNYSCDSDLATSSPGGVIHSGITALATSHEVSEAWDDSDCKTKKAAFSACKEVSTTCVEGPSTKVINGVPVTKDCWAKEVSYQCLQNTDTTTCNEEIDSSCTVKSTECSEYINGVCQSGVTTYTCKTRDASTAPSTTCQDKDFAKVMTGLEGAREMVRYFDENTQTFFNGDASKCSVKLGGAIGGNCCKAAGDPNQWTDAAVSAGVSAALSEVGSAYTYEVLVSEGSSILSGVAATATAAGASGFGGSVATFGVGASVSANGALTITFNPALFAVAIAIMVVMNYLSCEPEEKKVAIRKKAGLCHEIGSYCSDDSWVGCLERSFGSCCYVSKLARIINEHGHVQLNKSWGSPENPQCSGFTQDEITKLDFSTMDLTEFMADIVYTNPNITNVNSSMGSGVTNMIKNTQGNYYDQ